MSSKIIFNGKEYASVDEMPADVREAYQQVMGIFSDADRNGVPDILEGKGAINLQSIQPMISSMSTIIYDGKTYASVNDLPPEAREKYEQAMSKLGAAEQNNAIRVETKQWSLNDKHTAPAQPAPPTTANATTGNSRLMTIGALICVLLFIIAVLLAVLLTR